MKPIFTTSDQTNRVVSLFREMRIEQQLSFQKASEVLGFEVKSTSAPYQSAKRIAARDHGVVIEGVWGFGFTRLNGSGMVKKGFRTQAGIRRMARKGAAVASVAISQNLTRNEMVDVTQQLSVFRLTEVTNRQQAAMSNKKEREIISPAEPFDIRKALREATEKE